MKAPYQTFPNVTYLQVFLSKRAHVENHILYAVWKAQSFTQSDSQYRYRLDIKPHMILRRLP